MPKQPVKRRRISKLKKPKTFAEFEKDKEEQLERNYQNYQDARTWKKKKQYLKKLKDISSKGYHYYLCEDWEIFEQYSLKNRKTFVIERFRRIKTTGKLQYPQSARIRGKNIEYRICYYIVTPKNRWWFGQSCAFVPAEDAPKLIAALHRLKKRKGKRSSS